VSTGSESRWRELDGLRALAISLVLVNHLFVPQATGGWMTVLHGVLAPSWLGVDLFFVLSGYLITGILLRDRQQTRPFARFYLRRAVRIFPAYYAVLALVLLGIYAGASTEPRPSPTALAMFTAYAQNWWPVLLGSSGFVQDTEPLWQQTSHFWSLAVEEQFYLLWPLLLWWLPRQRVALGLGLIYLGVLGLKLCLWRGGADPTWLFFATFSRCDALVLGAWVAACQHEGKSLRPLAAGWMGLLLLLLVAGIHAIYTLQWPTQYWRRLFGEVAPLTAAAALLFTWMIVRLRQPPQHPRLRQWLGSAPLGWLAQLSYSLYLVHLPITHGLNPALNAFFARLGASTNLAMLAAGLVILPLCIAAALLLHHGLERPALRRRSAWERRWLGPELQRRS